MLRHATPTIHPRLLGRRLQAARMARGLTQQDTAEALAVARTTITAQEQGDRRIRPHELIRLASLYGRRVGDLVGPQAPIQDFAVLLRAAAFRAGTNDVQEDMRAELQKFQDLCRDYLQLEQLNGVSSRAIHLPQYPTAGMAPDEAGQDVASRERNRLGLDDGPILRLREMLELDVGLRRVFVIRLPSRVAGIFVHTDALGGCIAVNACHPAERRRWTLTHAYAHCLTNRYRSGITLLGSYRCSPATEQMADSFARCLLMPASGLRRRFNEIRRAGNGHVTAADVCRLAHYYFVSVEAMMLRLEELGSLPRGTWEHLCDRGFKERAAPHLGWLPCPSEDGLLPLRYKFLAAQAYQAENLTEGQVARYLRTDRVSARMLLQRLSQAVSVLDGGEVASLPLELAGCLTPQVA